ncbi:LapA family protein [Alicyclobacillus mali]|uniref:LapA family protein n=1 Tax=Alicyclobacillus mali (ex Roth et al. 2021) TaxID=1123961 RepID=A0ABS0F5Q9_9BACL|nr:LapA family protein [Alicyclobacillus mali (ex Roth et al. 2021)]MBF8378586.1 LapA family protein [Alicyclobacillus mali (ex Roth et al. 2021)]MCL6488379.1 LapA family protein [Alicyclobacillus mali (ex Roth et al. 2021)]
MRWKVLGAVVFAVLIVIFTLANSTDVSVNFVFTQARVNLVLVILLSVLLGMILMAILWSIHAWRLRGEIRARERTIAELESNVALLGTPDNANGGAEQDSAASKPEPPHP